MTLTDNRKYIVVDLENLLGADRSSEGVCEVWQLLKPLIAPGDQVMVATGPELAKVAVRGGCRRCALLRPSRPRLRG